MTALALVGAFVLGCVAYVGGCVAVGKLLRRRRHSAWYEKGNY